MAYLDRRDREHLAACFFELRGRLIPAADAVLHDRSRAEDVAQDIFMRLLDPGWRPKGLRLGVPFLLVKARRLAEARLGGEARRRVREFAAAADRLSLVPNGNPREDVWDLQEAVRALPAPVKLCLKHRYAGLSVKEIVKATGFSRHKVYNLLARACERLKGRLGDPAVAVLLTGHLGLAGAPASYAPVPEGFEGRPRRLSRRGPAHAGTRNAGAPSLFDGLALVLLAGAAVALAAVIFLSLAGLGLGGGDLGLEPQDREQERSMRSGSSPFVGPQRAPGRRQLDYLDVKWRER
jgi:DNA-directed RNA polymerase specialized sigma24 family protein